MTASKAAAKGNEVQRFKGLEPAEVVSVAVVEQLRTVYGEDVAVTMADASGHVSEPEAPALRVRVLAVAPADHDERETVARVAVVAYGVQAPEVSDLDGTGADWTMQPAQQDRHAVKVGSVPTLHGNGIEGAEHWVKVVTGTPTAPRPRTIQMAPDPYTPSGATSGFGVQRG